MPRIPLLSIFPSLGDPTDPSMKKKKGQIRRTSRKQIDHSLTAFNWKLRIGHWPLFKEKRSEVETMWKLEVWGWWAWIDWVLAGAFSGYHFGCGARQRSRRWRCWSWWCCCGPSQRDKRSEQKKSLRKLKKNSFFRYNDDGGGAGPGIWMATKSRLCGYGKLELISRRRRHHRDTMRLYNSGAIWRALICC